MWLCRRTKVINLFVDFCINDSDDRAISISRITHIKSIFLNMFHRILNFMYSSYFKIINYIDLEPFIFAIHPIVVLTHWFMCSNVLSF